MFNFVPNKAFNKFLNLELSYYASLFLSAFNDEEYENFTPDKDINDFLTPMDIITCELDHKNFLSRLKKLSNDCVIDLSSDKLYEVFSNTLAYLDSDLHFSFYPNEESSSRHKYVFYILINVGENFAKRLPNEEVDIFNALVSIFDVKTRIEILKEVNTWAKAADISPEDFIKKILISNICPGLLFKDVKDLKLILKTKHLFYKKMAIDDLLDANASFKIINEIYKENKEREK